MQYVGPLSVVDAALADHAEAVVREAVSNAVRHADATTSQSPSSSTTSCASRSVDDGRGMPADVTGSGLTNLHQRAADASGTFTVEALPGRGTKLRWCAPLP